MMAAVIFGSIRDVFSFVALTCALWIGLVIQLTFGQLSDNPDLLRNWCLDSNFHKTQPTPEPQLFAECAPWRDRACCNATVSKLIHHNMKTWQGFQLRHCPRQMSTECLRFFRRDFCFYECSPNLGPWVEYDSARTSRRQRFRNVPLCASECEAWWLACKDDLTCVRNWGSEFDWMQGRNNCPEGSTCRAIGDVYSDAKDFCETVWDNDFAYTPDNQPCMKFFFDSKDGNPNDAVSELAIQEHLSTVKASLMSPNSVEPAQVKEMSNSASAAAVSTLTLISASILAMIR